MTPVFSVQPYKGCMQNGAIYDWPRAVGYSSVLLATPLAMKLALEQEQQSGSLAS
jgi:hypothetical protein